MVNVKKSREVAIAAAQSFKERGYWSKKFAGDWELSYFPYDIKSSGGEKKIDTLTVVLPGDVSSGMVRLSNNSDRRLFMILLTGLTVLLARYTDNDDITVGSPVEKQQVEGDFINTVLGYRNILKRKMSFKDLLLLVRKTVIEAIENQNYPLETLIEDLKQNQGKKEFKLFDVAVLLENIHHRKYIQQMGYNVLFAFSREGQRIEAKVEYNALLYEPITIRRIANHFEKIVAVAMANPDVQVGDIDILSAEEKRQLLSRPGDSEMTYPADTLLHDLFSEQVGRRPDTIALVFEEHQLTYRELDDMSNRVAWSLKAHGAGDNTIAAILAERSIEMVAGLLGILKSGSAYLPLDPNYPQERIKYMINDSGAALMLSYLNGAQPSLDDLKEDLTIIDIQDGLAEEEGSPARVNEAHGCAYIIYTSGSTGKPKGVAVEHHSIVNTVNWRRNYYKFDQDEVVLQLPSFSFDSSVEDIFTPLSAGSKLVLIQQNMHLDMEYIGEKLEKNGVTHFLIVPYFYKTFLEMIPGSLTGLKSITVAGESFTDELVQMHFEKLAKVKLFNEYGPTENSVCATVYEFKEDEPQVLIGKPIDGVSCLILNRYRELSPVGVSGQLYLSGKGLARGYLNRVGQTHGKFVDHPFTAGEKMYATGDSARWLNRKDIEFLGRTDLQVKIRGFRIEIGEIENQLRKYSGVQETVILPGEDRRGNKFLCAYLVMDGPLDVQAMMVFLLKSLPDYMVPAYFFKIDRIPLTPNGKIDWKLLPRPDETIDSGMEYVAPRNELEEKLAGIWKGELQIDRVGVKDNYFAIGGDSIKSIRLVSIINKKLAASLKIVDLYVNYTIETLANFITNHHDVTDKAQEFAALQEIEDLKGRIMNVRANEER